MGGWGAAATPQGRLVLTDLVVSVLATARVLLYRALTAAAAGLVAIRPQRLVACVFLRTLP
jgi:hypothetical protein